MTNHCEQEPAPIDDGDYCIFNKYYPLGYIYPVRFSSLPPCAILTFQEYHKKLADSPMDYFPEQSSCFFRIENNDGTYTWATWITKSLRSAYELETNFYLCDTTHNGKNIGHAEARFLPTSPDPAYHDKPRVGWNETDSRFVRHGYGTRRLILMNALSCTFWCHPLHSDNMLLGKRSVDEASEIELWKHLEEMSLVHSYQEGIISRYVFENDSEIYSLILSSAE